MKIKLFILLWCIVTILSCRNNDSFYSHTEGIGYSRLPLIEPYYALILKDNPPWCIHNTPWDSGSSTCLMSISHLCVMYNDSIIVGYNNKEYEDPFQDYRPMWGFFVTNKDVHAVFFDKQEFLDSLRCYTHNSFTLRKVNEIRQELRENGYLEWFPDEYKPKK
jgi:hypothetical protein